jgi:hypothetical protein
VPARVIIDERVTPPKRERIEATVRAHLAGTGGPEDLLAVVTRLPSGRLNVYIDHVNDPGLIAQVEAALSRLE